MDGELQLRDLTFTFKEKQQELKSRVYVCLDCNTSFILPMDTYDMDIVQEHMEKTGHSVRRDN